MKRLLLVLAMLLVVSSANADPYELPAGTKAWGGASGWKSDINKIFNYFGATAGEPEADPTIIGPLTVSGTGNSYLAMPNNATFSDVITGLYLWTFYEGYPYTALNGTLKRLALFEELGTSGLVETPPAYRDSTGTKGQYAYSANGLTRYDCVATNTWFTSTLTDSLGLTPTPPAITGLTLAANGTTLTMVASEAITQGSGFSVSDLECVGPVTGTVAVDSVTSGDGTETWVMELASPMLQTSEEGAVVLNYPGTTDGIEDDDGTDLAAIAGMSVTNNSIQTAEVACATDSVTTANEGAFIAGINLGADAEGQSFQVISGDRPLSAIAIYVSSTSAGAEVELRWGASADLSTTYESTTMTIASNADGSWQKAAFDTKGAIPANTTRYFGAVLISGDAEIGSHNNNPYANGTLVSGTLWNMATPNASYDLMFRIYQCD